MKRNRFICCLRINQRVRCVDVSWQKRPIMATVCSTGPLHATLSFSDNSYIHLDPDSDVEITQVRGKPYKWEIKFI